MLAHLAALAALFPAAAAPTALAPAVPAPTDVTVAWASNAHKVVLLTWNETGDLADHVTLLTPDGSPTDVQTVPAGRPNRIEVVATTLYRNLDLRYSVQPVDASGRPIGDAGRSPVFDTDTLPSAVLTEVLPRRDGTTLLAWKLGPAHDDTPGDPLDLPADPARYIPTVYATLGGGGSQPTDLTRVWITATSFIAPAGKRPAYYSIEVGPNEFGSPATSENVTVDRTDLTVSAPHTATTGRPLRVTGASTVIRLQCDDGPNCAINPGPDAARALRLEARTTGADAAWQTVATTTTVATGKTAGDFTFRLTSPGTRQYRVVAEPTRGIPDVVNPQTYAVSSVATVRSSGGGGGLPITGAPTAWIAAAGALLVALGAALAAIGRRRRA